MYFLVTKILLQPYPLLILMLAAAIARLWLRRGENPRRLFHVTAAFLALVVASLPVVVHPFLGSLEWAFPPLAGRPAVDALVVLAGGIREPDRVRPEAELSEDSLVRCLHAADLYRRGGPLPVIVTGGMLDPKAGIPPVAPAMRDLLVRLGVRESDVVVEPLARTTEESAVLTKDILGTRGLRRVALVTEAVHMRRSLLNFRRRGIDVAPAPCGHRATQLKLRLDGFIPSPRAMKDLADVAHEWLGLAWYRARGRI